jgi:hypothetical protein
MADTKLSAIVTELTAPAGTERIYVADGTTSKFSLLSTLKTWLVGNKRQLITGLTFVPTATDGALPGLLTGGAGEQSVLGFLFDATVDKMVSSRPFIIPPWFPGSTGVDVKFMTTTTATSGNMVWQAAFRRLNTGEDIDTTAHSYSYQSSGAVATSGTAGQPTYVTISFSSAQIDSFVAGEAVILMIRRDADNTSATDSITGANLLLHPSTVAIYEA